MKAFALRKPTIKDDDQQGILKLANWLEDYDLFDEAQAERLRVYELRKAVLPSGEAAEAKEHEKIAKWCLRYELLPQAEEQYASAIVLKPQSKTYTRQVDKIRKQLTIPMDPGFYRAARKRLAAAARYVRKQQDGDGGIGRIFLWRRFRTWCRARLFWRSWARSTVC